MGPSVPIWTIIIGKFLARTTFQLTKHLFQIRQRVQEVSQGPDSGIPISFRAFVV